MTSRKHDAVHEAMLTRTEEILYGYLPDIPADQAARVASMSLTLLKAGIDLIMAHEGAEREAYTGELKAVMFRYLEPLVCDEHQGAPTPPIGTP